MSLTLHGITAVRDSSFLILTWKYAGWLGSGKGILSLLSIATTSDMVGRSAAFSCTHNSAMLMHLMIPDVWHPASSDASTS